MTLVKLGAKEYEIASPSYRHGQRWRVGVGKAIGKFVSDADGVDDPKDTKGVDLKNEENAVAMFDILLSAPLDVVAESVFTFSPEIEADREVIENEATEAEIIIAWETIWEVVEPIRFFTVVMGTVDKLTPKA